MTTRLAELSRKYRIYAHLCGELITLPVPQPMLYPYDFNFMAKLNTGQDRRSCSRYLVEGNEYV